MALTDPSNLKRERDILVEKSQYLEGVSHNLLSDLEQRHEYKRQTGKTLKKDDRDRKYEKTFNELVITREKVKNLEACVRSLQDELDAIHSIEYITEMFKKHESDLLENNEGISQELEVLRGKLVEEQENSQSLQAALEERHQEVIRCEEKAEADLLVAKKEIEKLVEEREIEADAHKTEVEALKVQLNLEMDEKQTFQNTVVTLEGKISEMKTEIFNLQQKIKSENLMTSHFQYQAALMANERMFEGKHTAELREMKAKANHTESELTDIITNQNEIICWQTDKIAFEHDCSNDLRRRCNETGMKTVVLSHQISEHADTISALQQEIEILKTKLAEKDFINSTKMIMAERQKAKVEIDLLTLKVKKQEKEIVRLKNMYMRRKTELTRFKEQFQACSDAKHETKEFDRLFFNMKRNYLDAQHPPDKKMDLINQMESEIAKQTEEYIDKHVKMAHRNFKQEKKSLNMTIGHLEDRLIEMTGDMSVLCSANQTKTKELDETKDLLSALQPKEKFYKNKKLLRQAPTGPPSLDPISMERNSKVKGDA